MHRLKFILVVMFALSSFLAAPLAASADHGSHDMKTQWQLPKDGKRLKLNVVAYVDRSLWEHGIREALSQWQQPITPWIVLRSDVTFLTPPASGICNKSLARPHTIIFCQMRGSENTGLTQYVWNKDGRVSSVIISLNEDYQTEAGILRPGGHEGRLYILLHELGHGLGLPGHSTDCHNTVLLDRDKCVAGGNFSTIYRLGSHDVTAIRAVYEHQAQANAKEVKKEKQREKKLKKHSRDKKNGHHRKGGKHKKDRSGITRSFVQERPW